MVKIVLGHEKIPGSSFGLRGNHRALAPQRITGRSADESRLEHRARSARVSAAELAVAIQSPVQSGSLDQFVLRALARHQRNQFATDADWNGRGCKSIATRRPAVFPTAHNANQSFRRECERR